MFDREMSVGHLVSWATRLFNRLLDRRLQPLSLSAGQVPILLVLAERIDATQKELVQNVAIAQPAMAQLLKRMHSGNLVACKQDPDDGRVSRYSLTPRAWLVFGQLVDILEIGNDEAFAGFDAKEKAQMNAMMQRVIANLCAAEARQG